MTNICSITGKELSKEEDMIIIKKSGLGCDSIDFEDMFLYIKTNIFGLHKLILEKTGKKLEDLIFDKSGKNIYKAYQGKCCITNEKIIDDYVTSFGFGSLNNIFKTIEKNSLTIKLKVYFLKGEGNFFLSKKEVEKQGKEYNTTIYELDFGYKMLKQIFGEYFISDEVSIKNKSFVIPYFELVKEYIEKNICSKDNYILNYFYTKEGIIIFGEKSKTIKHKYNIDKNDIVVLNNKKFFIGRYHIKNIPFIKVITAEKQLNINNLNIENYINNGSYGKIIELGNSNILYIMKNNGF